MDEIIGLLITLAFFTAIVLSLYYYYRARNKERMALIEKGMFHEVPKKKPTNNGLKFGVFLMGLSIGIFLGYILAEHTRISEVVAYLSMILLFGGISLILNNFIVIKKLKAE